MRVSTVEEVVPLGIISRNIDDAVGCPCYYIIVNEIEPGRVTIRFGSPLRQKLTDDLLADHQEAVALAKWLNARDGGRGFFADNDRYPDIAEVSEIEMAKLAQKLLDAIDVPVAR